MLKKEKESASFGFGFHSDSVDKKCFDRILMEEGIRMKSWCKILEER